MVFDGIMSVRQVVSILISYAKHGHSITPLRTIGLVLVFAGLSYKSLSCLLEGNAVEFVVDGRVDVGQHLLRVVQHFKCVDLPRNCVGLHSERVDQHPWHVDLHFECVDLHFKFMVQHF